MAARGPLPPLPREYRGGLLTEPRALEPYSRAAGPLVLQPLAVALPLDREDVAALVTWAHEEGVPLVPRGGGTGMPGGNVGRGVVVDLRKLDGISSGELGEGRLRAGAGVVAARIEETARRAGWFFPPLPSSSDRCTLGGMLANNAAGARSFRYGAVREWVEVLEVILPDGTPARLVPGGPPPPPFRALHTSLRARLGPEPPAWPRVTKNSSGYALDRFLPEGDGLHLLLGSEGTLGIVVEAEIRLAPLPAAERLLCLRLPSPTTLPALVESAREVDAAVCEFFAARFLEVGGVGRDELLGPLVEGAWALALVELSGTPDEVERSRARLRRLEATVGTPAVEAAEPAARGRLWELRHAASPILARSARHGLFSTQFIEDPVVPPHRLPELLLGLEEILAAAGLDAVVFGHAGDGNPHVNVMVAPGEPDWRDRVRDVLAATADLVRELGGTLSGEHGDGRIRTPFLSRVWSPFLCEAFREVKVALDPRAILNPGVVVPAEEPDPLEALHPESRRLEP